MLLVLCSVEKRCFSFGRFFFQENYLLRIVLEFGFVAGLELCPLRGIVTEPLSKFGAGGDLFKPEIDVGFFFSEASWPEPVYEDAGAVFFGGGFVDALELDCHDFLLRMN